MPNNEIYGAYYSNKLFLPSLLIILSLIPSTWSGFACMENPCMHGICIDRLEINNTHQCYCRNGFTGYSCGINWDECRSQPCLNGGRCVDGIASFNCSCPENFAGVYCEIDLSFCEDIFPCQNNGTCKPDTNNVTGTGFICSCPSGFTGHQCEIDISVCNETENVCQNGGKCVDGVGNRFYCECQAGWSGHTCTIDIDECNSQPCLNGGICVNKINDFSCACDFGYTGKACETKLSICDQAENPCLNGAFCLKEQDDASKKTCYCVPDFHGEFCESRYNDCEPPPKCFNGGTCYDGVGEFKCDCIPPFFGPTCQCTEDNATEPECSIYINGTMPTLPSFSDSIYSSMEGLHPTPSLQVPMPSPLPSAEIPGESSEPHSDIRGTPSVQPETPYPTPSPYDPGGEGRDGLDTISPLVPESSIGLISPEESSREVIVPTQTIQPSPSHSIPLQSESPFVTMYLEPSSTISLDGSEETLSFSPQSPATSMHIPPASDLATPSPSPSPPSGADDSSEMLDTTKVEVTLAISEVPAPTPPGIHTVDLTAAISHGLSSPDADIVEPITDHVSSPILYPSSSISPPQIESDLPTPDDSLVTTRPPGISVTPSLPYITDFASSDGVKEGVVTMSLLPPDVGQSIAVESSAPGPAESIGASLLPTPAVSGDLPDRTPIMSSPPFEGDYETITATVIIPTPTMDLPFPTPSPTALPNATDPCTNYCHNNAKCISDTQPICLCSFKYTGSRCETPKEKFRAASFTGDSFLSYRVPNESIISKVDIRSKLVTIVPEGILLYTGVGRMYALIFTQNGHVTLHFSCGSQSMHFVETRTRVDNGFNFTLDFKMDMTVQGMSQLRCSAEVSVNQSFVMKGEQVVGRDGMIIRSAADHPIERVFLGGIPPFHTDAQQNDDLVGILPGFRGCLHTLMINQDAKDIYDDALDGKEVAECGSFGCVANPCHGSATCVTTHAYPFWECLCPPGYKGHRCQIIVCSRNPCQNGATCTYSQETLSRLAPSEKDEEASTTTVATPNSDELQPLCLCPLGFGGAVCQHEMNLTKPAFHPISGYSSFIAYDPIPRFIDWFQLKFHFVTKNISQISLLLYTGNNRGPQPLNNNNYYQYSTNDLAHSTTAAPPAQNSQNNNHMMLLMGFDQTVAVSHPEPMSDFFAITFLQGFIALTWNLGSGTQRITTPSRIDNRLNIHTLFAGRSGRQAWLKVDGMRNITGKTPGPLYRLNSNSNELYIGGYKNYKFEGLSHDLPLHQGFHGCIFDLGFRVKNRLYLPIAKSGRNVKNCFEEDC